MFNKVVTSIVLGFLFLPNIVLAETLVERMKVCAKTKDSLVRLMCYDNLAKDDLLIKNSSKEIELKVVNKRPTTPEKASSSAVTAKVKNEDDSFGGEHLVKEKSYDGLKQVNFIIASANKDIRGNLRFVFENGQVWKQTDKTHFSVKVKEHVKISKGMLGAFYLKKLNQNKSIKVKRIK